jgi:hypothetical protein
MNFSKSFFKPFTAKYQAAPYWSFLQSIGVTDDNLAQFNREFQKLFYRQYDPVFHAPFFNHPRYPSPPPPGDVPFNVPGLDN